MNIAIIGGGLTGLTAGFYLSLKGFKVTVFEKEKFLGGLASGFKAGDWYIDRCYHHIFKSDKAILKLTKDLGLKDIWFWKKSGAPIFYQGAIYPFTSPIDLLTFSPLSLVSRLRMGLASFYLMQNKNFKTFQNQRADLWLKKYMGSESWKIIWEPLMKKKFGKHYQQISMTWMWARVHKRSSFLGYPSGGFQVIIEKLKNKIEKNRGTIELESEVKNLNQLKSFDQILITCANPIFLQIVPKIPASFKTQLKKIKYYGAITILLKLKKSLMDQVYWLNINDEKIPFVVCVQQTNFIPKKYYHNNHFVYLASYINKSNALFKLSDKVLLQKWLPFVTRINSSFKPDWIKNFWVYKEPYTQPIFRVGDYQYIPEIKTQLKNIYLANMSQVYPWDRGTNYAVELGKKAAFLIADKTTS